MNIVKGAFKTFPCYSRGSGYSAISQHHVEDGDDAEEGEEGAEGEHEGVVLLGEALDDRSVYHNTVRFKVKRIVCIVSFVCIEVARGNNLSPRIQ